MIFTASDSKEYPKQPVAPSGPTIQDNSLGAQVQSVTFQDLLKVFLSKTSQHIVC